MISKDEILKRGAVEVHAKVGGVRQRHTLKVHMEKTAWGSVPFCVSSFQLPVSELVRIAKEIGLPVKCKGMSVFPPGKAAQDFAIKEEALGKKTEKEKKKPEDQKDKPDDEKKKPEKKKRLAHERVLGSESGVSEESENDESPKGKEDEKEDDEESEEEPEDVDETGNKDAEKEIEEEKKTKEAGLPESIAILESELKTAEDVVGPIIEVESPSPQVQIESEGNGKNIESDQNAKQKEKDDKEKKKFASDVLSEGILR